MKHASLLVALVMTGPAFAQDPILPREIPQANPGVVDLDRPVSACVMPCATRHCGFAGNHEFDNFIGFLSNPLQNIDPRAMTAIWPIYIGNWFTTTPALPDGNVHMPGAGLYVALSDRLSFGINQGGYGWAYLNRDAPSGPFVDRLGKLRNRREFGGQREGWLNIGGFVQYTLVKDVQNQCLFTAGLRWDAAMGSQGLFQGYGPTHLTPYVTFAKGWGDVHLLGTVGYHFPAAPGGLSSELVYANFHLDRQFGWLYPLLEVNSSFHTTPVAIDAPLQGGGFIDFGTFSATGNIVTLAVGANAVLSPGRLEVGAVYNFPVYTQQRGFDFDGVLVKMLVRY